MIGAIIGDIAGSRFEWENCKSKDFQMFHKRCRPTDDSVMSLAIARAILITRDDRDSLAEQAVVCMQELGREYDVGYGSSFKKWIWSENPRPYNSFGNGAAMKVSACGFAADSLEEAIFLSSEVTKVTHNHPEGMKGAEAVAAAVYLGRTGKSKEEIREYICRNYYPIQFTLDEIRPFYKFDVSCQGSVPVAFEAFFESVDFEDAIRNAISVGGDSDTIGAITGAVAEACYGVPEGMIRSALNYLDGPQKRLLYDFEKAYPSKAIGMINGIDLTVFDVMNGDVDKMIPEGTTMIVDKILGAGAIHAWVNSSCIQPADKHTAGKKKDR